MRFLTFINGAKKLVSTATSSSGVADADKIPSLGTNGRLHASMMPEGFGNLTEVAVCAEPLQPGDFVNFFSSGGVRYVRKADASNNRPANGFVLVAFAQGESASVQTQGLNSALSALTIGSAYYLSNTQAGAATASLGALTPGHIIQELGCATSEMGLLFEFDTPTGVE
jgi:hypothetical protein